MLIPTKDILVNQAKLIVRTNLGPLISPRFYVIDQKNLELEQSQQPDMQSWMGLPVFDTVVFDEIRYTTNDGKNIGISKMTLQNCMHVVNMVKNVVKTPISGGDGTVKEYIGMGDYVITLSGMLVSQHANTPPTLEKKQLIDFCKAPVPINLYSNFLADFEVFSIVVEGEPTFTQIEGTRNAVMFTVPCCSDKPFEVEYNSFAAKFNPKSRPSF